MKLCINADDVGLCPSVDLGIVRAVEAGVVTSVSAMVVSDHLPDALGALAAHPVSVGAHVVAGVGVGPVGNLKQAWTASSETLRARFETQVSTVQAHWASPLSHVDTHQHIHALPRVRRAVDAVRQAHGIPGERVPRAIGGSLKQRALSASFFGRPSIVGFFGVDLMGAIDKDAVDRALGALEDRGVTEAIWMVHPGEVGPDHPEWDDYRAPREAELASLLAMADWLRDRVTLVPMTSIYPSV